MSLGVWEIAILLVIVLIIFGAGKLPKVAGDLAKGIKTFKKGLTDPLEGEVAKPGADTAPPADGDKLTPPPVIAQDSKDKAGQ